MRYSCRCAFVCLFAVLLIGCSPTTGSLTLVDPPVSPSSHVYARGAVATDHPLASQAGADMLSRGGNAVDAAVAASFCLSVVRPYSCGIGGGGFMVIHMPGTDGNPPRAIAINYRETAPAAIGPSYYVDLRDALGGSANRTAASRIGPHAIGVPGTVAGLLYALDTYGTLDRRTVLQPAIGAARHGFSADEDYVASVQDLEQRLAQIAEVQPEWRNAASYTWSTLANQGRVSLGDRVQQPAQARALELIAEQGAAAFYHGPIADAVVRAVQRAGGVMTLEDLARYRIDVTEPLRSRFGDFELLTMPPPSSGGVALAQIFGVLDRWHDRLHGDGPTDADYLHVLIEAMKHAFADRAEYMADAAFVEVPINYLLSPAYLDDLARRVDQDGVLSRFAYGSVQPGEDDSGTSHLSVVDPSGMAVACTETINLRFGSTVAVPEFGIILNNEMDDFTTIPGAPNAFGLRQSDRNLPEPGKRPLSSMSPTIVLRDGEPFAIAGASGGPRIITATAQVLLNVMRFDMPADDAIDTPRLHHQWVPESLLVESTWSDDACLDELRDRGHAIEHTETIGVVQLIRRVGDAWHAASDPRKGGAPAGID